MKIEIPEFEMFMDSNLSGRMIINPSWLEYLLNLFYQGYFAEVSDEILDTIVNHSREIKMLVYGIIGKEFDKKHLKMEEMTS